MRTDRVPGLAIVKGIWFAFRQVLRPKVTVQYPEVHNAISPRHRGRLILLYDEAGTLKCETCFQCAAACPIECIDMGGVDTRDRYHVHWGPAEQYAERREESALRRSGRPVPGPHLRPLRAHRPGAARRHPGRGGPPAAPRHAPSWSGPRRPTVTCPSPRCSTSPTRPAPGTASSTASPPPTRTCASSRRAATSCASAAARSARCAGGGRVLAAFREHLGTDVGGVSPDGAVRLETTDCHGDSPGSRAGRGRRRGPAALQPPRMRPRIAAALRAAPCRRGRPSGR